MPTIDEFVDVFVGFLEVRMITQIRLENFKCFRDLVTVDLKPITVFVGPNSGGKSTLTQPLLLFKQSKLFKASKNEIPTSGPIIDLGEPKHLFNTSAPNNEMVLGLSIAETNFHPDGDAYRPITNTAELSNKEIMFNPVSDFDIIVSANDKLYLDRFKLNGLRFLINNNYIPRYSLLNDSNTNFEIDKKRSILSELNIDGNFGNFKVSKRSIGYSDEEGRLVIDTSKKHQDEDFLRKEHLMEVGISNLNFFPQILHFVPAWRSIPKYFTQYKSISPHNSDTSYLETIIGRYTNYMASNDQPYKDNSIEDNWLKKLNIGYRLVSRAYKHGIELLVDVDGDNLINVASMGMGVSQLIPIIILSNIDYIDTLIIQEPESHLHPNTQRKIAELLAANVGNRQDEVAHIGIRNKEGIINKLRPLTLGSQYIIETHSEHIVRGFQIAVAKGIIKNSDVAIYFVDASQENPIVPMELDEKGMLMRKWPNDFYGLAYSMTLELNQIQSDN